MQSEGELPLSLMTPAAKMQLEPLQDIVMPAFVERSIPSSNEHQKFEIEFVYEPLDSQKSKPIYVRKSFDFIGGD